MAVTCVQAGSSEIFITRHGSILVKGPYDGITEAVLTKCIAMWCGRFGGCTPKLNTEQTHDMFIQGGAAMVITKRNKASFRFTIIPTPQTIITIDEMKSMETIH